MIICKHRNRNADTILIIKIKLKSRAFMTLRTKRFSVDFGHYAQDEN